MIQAEFPSLRDYLRDELTAAERSHLGFITFSQWPFAIGAVVETALEARALGSDVTVGFWADETPMHDTGWIASRRIARLLRSHTRDENAERALRAAGMPAQAFASPPIRRWRPADVPALPERLTRADVRALTYKGARMGRAILQVSPALGIPIRETYEWPRRFVERSARSYAWAFDQAQALIRARGITTISVYNGRFMHDCAVSDAAEQLGVRVLYYDTGGYETDFDLTTAATHDWTDLQYRMLRMYDGWDPAERDALGSRWFISRQTHADERNAVFTGKQARGHLDGVPDAERLVVFFSSSGDEIAELDIDWADYLHSQEHALEQLVAACDARPDVRLVVRTHPHMRMKAGDDLAEWTAIVERLAPDAHFDPHSPIDSYALMERADVVFTYGSTTGVEAAFLGRPVVVMGPSAYDVLGCAVRVRTTEEIGACIDEPPQPNAQAAIPFGLMMERRGFRFAHIDGHGDDTSLAGVPIAEANETALKVSDVMRRRQLASLLAR